MLGVGEIRVLRLWNEVEKLVVWWIECFKVGKGAGGGGVSGTKMGRRGMRKGGWCDTLMEGGEMM